MTFTVPSSDNTTVSDSDSLAPIKAKAPRVKVHYFGDYELLEEIARGGMGVVFKARQVSLNRIVAVKMILGGRLAGEADIRRFRLEAEAAANLQHPNIVAIHEVGEQDGEHYFSMDYVDGVNLAQYGQGKPMPPLEAVKLVQILAEAVHFAHQRGTLHRDLKPQNVLIDKEGRPRITDFGLAKLAEKESELTRTGAAMGSPSYMPPEQAAGKLDQIGPASDVYALGAILYELLTGTPPFRGDTPLATMHQVLHEDPVAPTKRFAELPPDLETICLKCLEKLPERRYHSAKVLAEELGRFLNHEPILARPVSSIRKAWTWGMRHPWAVTGVITLLFVGLIGLAFGLWEQNRFLIWQAAHPGISLEKTDTFAFLRKYLIVDGLGRALALLIMFGFLVFTNYLGPFLYIDFVQRKSNRKPIGKKIYWTYVILGSIATLASVAWILRCIHEFVWGTAGSHHEFTALFGLCNCWGGFLLLWSVIRDFHTATFGQRGNNDAELFSDEGFILIDNCPWTVILGVFLLFTGKYLGELLYPDQGLHSNMWAVRWAYFWVVMTVPWLPPLIFLYWRSRHAFKHLCLLGILMCIAFLLFSNHSLAPSPVDITMSQIRWAQFTGLIWGLFSGGVIIWTLRWENQRKSRAKREQ